MGLNLWQGKSGIKKAEPKTNPAFNCTEAFYSSLSQAFEQQTAANTHYHEIDIILQLDSPAAGPELLQDSQAYRQASQPI